MGTAASWGARPGRVWGGRPGTPEPRPRRLCLCALLEEHCRPISRCPVRGVLWLQDLILHRREAGVSAAVTAQTEVSVPLGLSANHCRRGGPEVSGKREDCAGPCWGVCGKEKGRERAVPCALHPAAGHPAARGSAPRHPASRAPGARLTRRLPGSPCAR